MTSAPSPQPSPFPSLQDRVVIVTGGARGLGREMALALVEAGARVLITASSDSGAMRETLAQAATLAAPGRMIGMAADVADYAQCEGVVARAIAEFGAVHVLINNAGRGMRLISETFNTEPALFWKADPQAWKQIIDTNVTGAFNMARAAVPGMVAAGFGKVINVSTSDQTMVRTGYSPYGPSKAALESASRVWAADLQGTGVDVMVYLPGGATDTDLLPAGANKRGADGLLLPPAIMRRGVLWLCADDSNGKSGTRYIARLWKEELPAAEAAEGARAGGHFLG